MATATGYLALGSRPACTSMHQETLLLPSVNVGSGDLIIQVLTSLHSIRQAAAATAAAGWARAGQGRQGLQSQRSMRLPWHRRCLVAPALP